MAMDGLGHQLLAGSTLSRDQNRHVRRRHQGDVLEELLHGGGRTDERLRPGGRRLGFGPSRFLKESLSQGARLITAPAWSRSNGLTR